MKSILEEEHSVRYRLVKGFRGSIPTLVSICKSDNEFIETDLTNKR